MYDNIAVGPTAEDVDTRVFPAKIDPVITSKLHRHADRTVPTLNQYPVVGMYTGIRPATETKDYHIIPHIDR